MHPTNESAYLPYSTENLPDGPWLILAPHPDDETFGMGGTLLLAQTNKIMVDILFITDGSAMSSAPNISEVREKEALEVCRQLSIRKALFWQETDRELTTSQHLVNKLSDLITHNHYATVFFPSPQEPHPDHRSTSVLAWESLRLCHFSANPISYEISLQAHTNQLIDISSVVTKKQSLMALYNSQMSENNYIDRILGLNQSRAWSLPLSVSHAEAFYLWPKEDRPLNALLLSIATQQSSLQALPNKLPLISVITRTQNRPEFLRESLRSVAAQVYPNIELVVINDGGQKVSQLIEEEATGSIQSFTYQHIETQSGRSHAANMGLDLCKGEYILFLDDDDWIEPDHLSKLFTAQIQHPEIKVTYTGVQCIDENKNNLPVQFAIPFDSTRLLSGNYIPIHSALFSRSLLTLGCRIDESLDVYEDWDFWIQASMFTQFLFIEGFSAIYRNTGQSDVGLSSFNSAAKEQASLILFKKWLPRLENHQLAELTENLRQGYHKSTQLLKQNVLIQDKEKVLQSLTTQLENQKLTLQNKSEKIIEQEKIMLDLSKAISNKDLKIQENIRYINDLIHSSSWQITHPLRILFHQLKRVIYIATLINPALRLGGGFKSTAKKAIFLYRRDGLSGIKQGFRKIAVSTQNNTQVLDHPIFQVNATSLAHKLLAPRVLIIAELSIPQCKKYRVTQKQKMFEQLGIDCTVCDWTDYLQCINELSTHSFVIFYRVPAYPNVLKLFTEAKRLKITTLWEVDDLIFNKKILAKSKTLARLDHSTYLGLLEGAILYYEAMLNCDKGIASTPELANQMLKAGLKEVFVVENALDEQTLNCSQRINASLLRPIDEYIRIVYGSGTNTHDVDFEEASPAILTILESFPNVKLRIIGTLELSIEYAKFESQIEQIPFCSYEAYLQYLAECDISIAPLENYIFNDSKSNIKFIEASIIKVPSICSPRSAFTHAIKHGANALLCESTDEWTNALESLINDEDLRHQIGLSAYDSVMENYLPENIAQQQLKPIVNKINKKSTQKTRVLSVNIFYAPQSFGGATIVAEETNKILNTEDEFEVYVFTALPVDIVPAYDVRRYEIDGTTIFGFGLPDLLSPTEQYDNVNVVSSFEKVLSAVKPDVVHFHSIQGIGLSVIDLCLKQQIKYVITLHDAWWICGRQFMINKQGQYCHQQTIDQSICSHCVDDVSLHKKRQQKLEYYLKKAERLLSPSQFFADLYLKNHIDKNKILVHKNGVLKPKYSPKRFRHTNPLTFCYVGGNTEIKGVSLVKQAFTKLSNPAIKLLVVDNATNLGYSSFDPNFFKEVNNVEIVPAYTQKTIDEFFSQVDVLLFPTQWKESFGLTIREALARKVWVIVTDAGAVTEDIIHGKNGLIIPFDDKGEAFTKAIEESVQFYQQFDMGSEIEFENKKITWFSDQADELSSIYKQIAAKNTP